jgi:hypothetical protein
MHHVRTTAASLIAPLIVPVRLSGVMAEAIRNVTSADLPVCSGFLGNGNLILRVHGKEFEIAEEVFSVETAA